MHAFYPENYLIYSPTGVVSGRRTITNIVRVLDYRLCLFIFSLMQAGIIYHVVYNTRYINLILINL